MNLLDTSNAETLTVNRETYFEWSYYQYFDPQTNSFEALKSSGQTFVIQNQDLLLELFTLFIYYKKTQEGFEGYNRWFEKWLDPIFIEMLSVGASNDLMHSKDEIRIENMKGLQHVNRNRYQSLQHWYIAIMKGILRTYQKNEQVINLIDKEIHRLTQ